MSDLERPFDLSKYRYVSSKSIAAGAQGEIWRVQDEQGLELALKIVDLKNSSWEDVKGLNREISALSRLDHENIVKTFDHGTRERLDEGRYKKEYFIVMELLGKNLAEQLDRSYSVDEMYWIAKQLVSGLNHAHGRGVIHRDLKPANVHYDLPTRQIKITDFGISKLLDQESRISSLGAGTLPYQAPEQLGLFDGKITEATDRYGTGLLLLTLLNGRQREKMILIDKPEDDLARLRRNLGEAYQPLLSDISLLLKDKPEERVVSERLGGKFVDDKLEVNTRLESKENGLMILEEWGPIRAFLESSTCFYRIAGFVQNFDHLLNQDGHIISLDVGGFIGSGLFLATVCGALYNPLFGIPIIATNAISYYGYRQNKKYEGKIGPAPEGRSLDDKVEIENDVESKLQSMFNEFNNMPRLYPTQFVFASNELIKAEKLFPHDGEWWKESISEAGIFLKADGSHIALDHRFKNMAKKYIDLYEKTFHNPAKVELIDLNKMSTLSPEEIAWLEAKSQ